MRKLLGKLSGRPAVWIGCCFAVSIAMILSAFLLSRFMVRVKQETQVSAKGYAEKKVRSDVGRFSFSIEVNAAELAAGYAALNERIDRAKNLLSLAGFTPDEIKIGGVGYQKVFKLLEDGRYSNDLLRYDLSQSVEVVSPKVDLMAEKYRELNALLAEGIQIQVYAPEFYISDLESHKLELTGDATRSATERAQVMARESGSELKELLSARLGVIQITRPASSDLSDYGTFDTSSVEKVIKVVVELKFSLR